MKTNRRTFKRLQAIVFVMFFIMLYLLGCCGSDEKETDRMNVSEANAQYLIQEIFFNVTSVFFFKKVDYTFADGATGACYQLVFSSNPVVNGPYCPTTINAFENNSFTFQ